MRLPAIAGCLLGVMVLAQCGPGPQARLTYSGMPDEKEIARLEKANGNLSEEQKQRLLQHQERALKKKLAFTILTQSYDAPFAGLGYVAGARTGYAVWRDGGAAFYPAGLSEAPLEKLTDQLARAKLAGRDLRKVLGVAASGTLMSWNADNATQQVVLRPQDTTFSQTRLYDAKALTRSNLVAMTVQDGGVELWNVISGSLVRKGDLSPLRPRRIARGSSMGRIYLGTEQGAVVAWQSGNRAQTLYEHKGPVLDLLWNPVLDQVISSAKDGTVIIWDVKKQGMKWRFPMKSPSYRLFLDPSGKCLVIVASVGTSYVFNLEQGTVFALGTSHGKLLSDVLFIEEGGVPRFAARYGAERVALWRADRAQAAKKIRSKFGEGVLDFAYSPRHKLFILATADGRVEYFDIDTLNYVTTALTAFAGISKMALDQKGEQLLVGLPNGQVVSFLVDPGQKTPLRIGVEEDQ